MVDLLIVCTLTLIVAGLPAPFSYCTGAVALLVCLAWAYCPPGIHYELEAELEYRRERR